MLIKGCDHVVIARGQETGPLDGRSQAWQIRLRLDADNMRVLPMYKCETRGWLGEQWSSWQERRGWLGGPAFDLADVLATDWRIAVTDWRT